MAFRIAEIGHVVNQITDINAQGEKLLARVSQLNNAIEHTESGTVTFSVFGKENGEKEHLVISVRDTGKGFPEEKVPEEAICFGRSR